MVTCFFFPRESFRTDRMSWIRHHENELKASLELSNLEIQKLRKIQHCGITLTLKKLHELVEELSCSCVRYAFVVIKHPFKLLWKHPDNDWCLDLIGCISLIIAWKIPKNKFNVRRTNVGPIGPSIVSKLECARITSRLVWYCAARFTASEPSIAFKESGIVSNFTSSCFLAKQVSCVCDIPKNLQIKAPLKSLHGDNSNAKYGQLSNFRT